MPSPAGMEISSERSEFEGEGVPLFRLASPRARLNSSRIFCPLPSLTRPPRRDEDEDRASVRNISSSASDFSQLSSRVASHSACMTSTACLAGSESVTASMSECRGEMSPPGFATIDTTASAFDAEYFFPDGPIFEWRWLATAQNVVQPGLPWPTTAMYPPAESALWLRPPLRPSPTSNQRCAGLNKAPWLFLSSPEKSTQAYSDISIPSASAAEAEAEAELESIESITALISRTLYRGRQFLQSRRCSSA
mmetsp:Transcript_35221/g.76400  ORF Transcript_35221/g.76400 Transcript_35221/m.76400 type:complete len:251 (-) Transcript_35221:369-1121(-)